LIDRKNFRDGAAASEHHAAAKPMTEGAGAVKSFALLDQERNRQRHSRVLRSPLWQPKEGDELWLGSAASGWDLWLMKPLPLM
jgi:hypothetical protein